MFAESSNGILYAATGFDAVIRWDGQSPSFETAGLVAPAATPAISASGHGAILGEYTAFMRYIDRFGFISNLSPISNTLDAEGTSTGNVTGATNASPIVITSTGHGLTTGDIVVIEDVGGNEGANGTWTITVVSADTFSLDDSAGDGAYTSGGTWTSGASTITFSNLELPSDNKVVRRQILRNTDGQSNTYYVDLDSTDMSSTSLSSTKTDTQLATGEAVIILDDRGLPLANRQDVPPNHKPFIAHHLDRMFYAGSVDYKRGHVEVTFGSATVQGIGTDWGSALAGRFLYVQDAADSYEIVSVDVANQTLTLTENYVDSTNIFGVYAIRPAPAEAKTFYFSEASFPESVSVLSGLSIPDDSDEITGLMVRGSFLYFLERRHIYKLTFESDPAKDGAIFLSSNRGCINNRCWVVVDDTSYMLDEEGIHRFTGHTEAEAVSSPIQEIFRPGSEEAWSINWNAQDWFHAVHSRQHSVIRWFVCFQGSFLPKHALAFNYRSNRWWIEEYPCHVGCSARGTVNRIPYVFLGCEARRVLALDRGYLDVVDHSLGTVRGTATSAGILSLTDSAATFSSSAVNAPLVIVHGTGKGQKRRIVSVASTTLKVDQPWKILPDATSIYQVGGIDWVWRSSWFRLADNSQNVERRLEVIFQPLEEDGQMDLRFYFDFSDEPDDAKVTKTFVAGSGIATLKDSPDYTIDLAREVDGKRMGVVSQEMSSHRQYYAQGRRYVQLALAGVANAEQQSVYEIQFEGAGNSGQIGGEG
jgi:hypothetical protein